MLEAQIETELYSRRFQSISRLVVILVLWVVIGSVAMGKAGIANFMELSRERDVLQSALNELMTQNQLLEEKINELKVSRKAQERFLKQTFGYLERNEYVFQFSNQTASNDIKQNQNEKN